MEKNSRGNSIFAKVAVVGARYLTKAGFPILILERQGNDVKVKAELSGRILKLPESQLLWPYKKEWISKEAIAMSQGTKHEPVSAEVMKDRVEPLKGKRLLKRTYKGKEHTIKVLADGFHYSGKAFPSLTAVASAITKQAHINGPMFFGLRKTA